MCLLLPEKRGSLSVELGSNSMSNRLQVSKTHGKFDASTDFSLIFVLIDADLVLDLIFNLMVEGPKGI